jgi:hypothetical protein
VISVTPFVRVPKFPGARPGTPVPYGRRDSRFFSVSQCPILEKGSFVMNITSKTARLSTKPGRSDRAVMKFRARIIAVSAGLLMASSAYAVNVQEVVQMITHTDLVMTDGTKMHADVVKMHGHMYVMIPVDDLPDYLHQQITTVMMHP